MVLQGETRGPRIHFGNLDFEKYVKRLKASFYSFDLKKDTFSCLSLLINIIPVLFDLENSMICNLHKKRFKSPLKC